MSFRSTVSTLVLAMFVGAVLVVVVGFQIGQPILLGYVVTGSMSPTLEPGDGFVALPPSIAGEVEQGDVITFDARELQGGGLTTHRVVGETSEGYITRGDANPFTDQDGPEPPVQESQIVSVALQLNGEVVVIPQIGVPAVAIQGVVGSVVGAFEGVPVLGRIADGDVGTLMMSLGVLILALSFLPGLLPGGRESAKRTRSREGVMRASVLLAVILFLIVAPVTANMVIPSGTQDLTIVSSSTPSQNPTVIQVGTSREFTYNVSNDGYAPRIVMLEPASTGIEVTESTLVVAHGETVETTVVVHAANQTGAYVRSLSERHYLQFLPASTIVALHRIHPYLAVLAIDAVVALVVTAIFLVSVGSGTVRLRSRARDLPYAARIQRVVRRWL